MGILAVPYEKDTVGIGVLNMRRLAAFESLDAVFLRLIDRAGTFCPPLKSLMGKTCGLPLEGRFLIHGTPTRSLPTTDWRR